VSANKCMLTVALLLSSSWFSSHSAHAQEAGLCGLAPALPSNLQDEVTFKVDLAAQASFLTKFVGRADLGSKAEVARKEIYQNSDKFFAAQKDAYLAYLFCVLITKDDKLDITEKLKALQIFKDSGSPKQPGSLSPSESAKLALLSQYKAALKEINYGIELRKVLVIPAMQKYIDDPSEDNWNNVLTYVDRLKSHIERILAMTLDYDSNFFKGSSGLISFVDFVDKGTPSTQYEDVFAPAIQLQSANNSTVQSVTRTVKQLPTIDQVEKWRDQFSKRAALLSQELERLSALLSSDTSSKIIP
jgi:hypothetical protein